MCMSEDRDLFTQTLKTSQHTPWDLKPAPAIPPLLNAHLPTDSLISQLS